MSFDRVLVPLDGSRLAEASLPLAKALARRLGSVLVLVHAVEEDPPPEVHGEVHLASESDAKAYLDQQRALCRSEGLVAEVHVTTSSGPDVPDAIVALATQLSCDLIAMCAHGRQSLRERFLGPIAQQALQGGGPPIMLRTAGASTDLPAEIRHILMPVDFRHDLTLPFNDLVALATGFAAPVTLLHAIDAGTTGLPARMLPNTTFELSDRTRTAAEQRIAKLAHQLQAQDIDVDTVVSTKDPDDAIIDEAEQRNTDLIMLLTHGRTGVTAWYERSVGQRIIQEPDLNLLLFKEPASETDTA
jgi:nucleotide-binding universal stress UspA family protein